MTAAFDPHSGVVGVVFPSKNGPQEQKLTLLVGEWLLDWSGAERSERLHVRAGARPQITLLTHSGACQLKSDRCELISGVRERHLYVDDGE